MCWLRNNLANSRRPNELVSLIITYTFSQHPHLSNSNTLHAHNDLLNEEVELILPKSYHVVFVFNIFNTSRIKMQKK